MELRAQQVYMEIKKNSMYKFNKNIDSLEKN